MNRPLRPHPFTVYRSPFTLYLHAVYDMSRAPNVLAVRFSSIGDVLLTTPLLRAIRRRHPACRIVVLTKQPFVPLLSHNPHVSKVLGATPERSLISLAAELRRADFTHLLDLHDSMRSWILRALVPGRWSTYPKYRMARSVLIHTKRNIYRDKRPVAERYFSAAQSLDVTPDGGPPDLVIAPESEREVVEWLENNRLGRDRPLVALAPGAAHATKRWPLEHWRKLLQRLDGQGFDVVIAGGADDVSIGSSLVDAARSRARNAAGRFGLQGTAALLRRARTLVSGDTGVMHMATAVGTPVVALFGPTVKPFGFFPYTARAQVVELGLPCRPCSSKGGPRCPLGHHRCMLDIAPGEVYQALVRSIR